MRESENQELNMYSYSLNIYRKEEQAFHTWLQMFKIKGKNVKLLSIKPCHLNMPSTHSLNKVAYKLASRSCINKLHQGHGHGPWRTCTSEQDLSLLFLLILFFLLLTLSLVFFPTSLNKNIHKGEYKKIKCIYANMKSSQGLLHNQNYWQHNL